MYPGIKIDRRRNAMLGVAGQTEPAGCRIVRVQPGSAADRGGLMADDHGDAIQNQQVPDFETLTTLIGERRPGDKVTDRTAPRQRAAQERTLNSGMEIA